jgi:recombination protein RecR
VLSPTVDNLVAQLTRLPGIGTRTAQRLAFHILAAPADEANAIGSAIAEVKARVRPCRECGNLTEEDLCGVCADPRRDRTVICVVEQPIDGVEPADLRIHRLMERVDVDGVEEVVLATNPTMTGEATAAYLADRLRDRVTVTRLASGLPVGGDLEYADEVTLGRALSGRRPA